MQTKTVKRFTSVFVTAVLLACTGCSSTSNNQPMAPAENVPAGDDQGRSSTVTETSTKTATVESLDLSSRTAILRNPDGSVTSYYCRPEVRRIDQIKIGDRVTFRNTRETIVVVGKGGRLPGDTRPTAIEREPEGTKAGGKIVDSMDFAGKIVKVDVRNYEVILQTGAAGVLRTVKVSRDINLAKFKQGDDAEARVTQVMAIAVETP